MRIVDFIRNGKLSSKEERTVYLVDNKSFDILIERDTKSPTFLKLLEDKETSFFIINDNNYYPFVVGMNFNWIGIFNNVFCKWEECDIKDILEEDDSYLALKYGKMLFRSIYE